MRNVKSWPDLGITNIDGRPLHAYRVDEEAYSRLHEEVRNQILRRQFRSCAALFVLWASERYRREYDGGPLSWEFLTEPLGISLEQEDLRDITRMGLAELLRPAQRSGGGTQYLRAIASEGGIPVRLLSGQGGGYRSALVGLVADLARLGLSCPHDVALAFAARRTLRLPIGYRTEEFRTLFVRFALEIVELRVYAPETLPPHDVEKWLDRVKPNWREGLSLRLDGDAARSLLSEAVAVTAQHGLVTDPISRMLYRTDADQWIPWIEVEENAEIASVLLQDLDDDRRRLRLAPVDQLAVAVPDLLLSLERDGKQQPWACRRISGRRTSRFAFSLETPAVLVAIADGQFLGRVRLAGGDAIEIGAGPSFWRLAEMGEKSARALSYAGNASLRTRDPYVWVLTAPDRAPQCTDGLTAELDGGVLGGNIWRLSGRGRVLIAGGNARVETAAEKDDRDEIHAIGPLEYRVLDKRGTPVHRGMPAIFYRQSERGYRHLSNRELRFRAARSGIWHSGTPKDATLGRVEIAVKEDGGTGARVIVNMVPSNFAVDYASSGDETTLRLRFNGVPPGWILSVEGGIPQKGDEGGVIEVPFNNSEASKARLSVTFADSDGGVPLAWTLDLPRMRGEIQTLEGETLARDRDITMHDIRAWRIVPAEQSRTDLRIRLHGGAKGGIAVIGQPIVTEQPLSAFRPIFEEMLVVCGADTELRLRAVTGGVQTARLRLRHVMGETRLVGDSVLVMHGQKAIQDPDLKVTAVDMDNPARIERAGPIGLNHLGNGRWFLLPQLEGVPMRPPRPLILPAPSESTGANAPNRATRVEHFAQMFQEALVETDLQRLAKLCAIFLENSISPSALDEIHALAKTPRAAVRLLTLVGPAEIEDILSLELHGGPRWSFIHPGVWAKGIAEYAQSLRTIFAAMPTIADRADELAREALTARLAEILRLRPALQGHVVLGLSEADPSAIHGIAERLGGLTPGLQNPDSALRMHANQVVQRNATTAPKLHDLAALQRPAEFDNFHTDMRGLIDAPLIVAEIAFGQRPQLDTRQQVALMQAILSDTAAFEAALPAAIAWMDSRLKKRT
ncbi:STY4851/ECs_5259 family protein [Hwanghaeella sp. LZ110]|uniref:STY4851/ECs_5259 family protein n=1 Tax=Hwanghaeella sp. LZ110 TaxID=3402810 RepID=UPI003B67905A